MMSGQETVRVYSYNPGAHTGLGGARELPWANNLAEKNLKY